VSKNLLCLHHHHLHQLLIFFFLLLFCLFLLPPPSLLSSTNAALAVNVFFFFILCGEGGEPWKEWGGAVDLLGTHAAALSHHSSYFLSRDFLFLIGVGVTHYCPPREISIPNCLDHPIHFCPGCCRRRFPSDQSWVLGLGFWLSSAGGGQEEAEEEEEEGWVGRAVVRSVMNGSQAQQERGWCVCWKTRFVRVGFSEKSLYPFVIYCRSCCKKKKKKKFAARRKWH